MKKPDKPKKRKTIEESWQEGRTNLIDILLDHRRAVERMALEHKIEAGDRQAVLACAAFAHYELLRAAKDTEKRRGIVDR